ncbi:rab-GTPase-TBC domain-containing protein [Melampsora americana]|nr:rab-GTPase-TBC domain-containing protein [Melampsora americana]
MGGGPSTPPDISLINRSEVLSPCEPSPDTRSLHSEDLIEVTCSGIPPTNDHDHAPIDEPLDVLADELPRDDNPPTDDDNCSYKLRWSKSKVYVHPTAFLRDNVPGYLGILQRARASFYLSWIPEYLLDSSSEREHWLEVETDPYSTTSDVMVTIPPESAHSASSRTHAFSIPINSIYSLILRPPTLSSWYGTVVVNLFDGITLPILYMHDDESGSAQFSRQSIPAALASQPPRACLPASWGGDALLNQLRRFADVLVSKIEPGLYLINPSATDREAHITPMFDDDSIFDNSPLPSRLTPRRHYDGDDDDDIPLGLRNSILHQSLNGNSASGSMDNMTFNILNSFSRITQNAKSAAQLVLSHKLAKPILPHLPKPFTSLANGEPDLVRWSQQAGVEGYDVARVYLAKWASIVAAQGEQARRAERGDWDFQETDDDGVGGGFEVVYTMYEIPRVRANRAPTQPIQLEEFIAWQDDNGRMLLPESECRKRIFQRGLAVSARKDIWLFLLGVYGWDSDRNEREHKLKLMKEQYEALKSGWESDGSGLKETAGFREEAHRIDIDCRRTDRTQYYFSDPSSTDDTPEPLDEGSNMPPTNSHVENLGRILMTYNVWEKELGYVQGMSDLCAPLYVVFEADAAVTFFAFVELMDRMKHHFLRDQSGMKDELSRLQKLLKLLDPGLYRHFDKTNSLNLFICFRWILIGFKREFVFQDVMKVWEAMWSDICGPHSDLFIALAILEKHREPIIRYLREFDEVLKYVNDLAMTLDCDEVLAQAEVLYLTFKSIVEKHSNDEPNPSSPSTSTQTQTEDKKVKGKIIIDEELRGLIR